MRAYRFALAAICCTFSIAAAAVVKPKVSGTPLDKFTIVYQAQAEAEEGSALAASFAETLSGRKLATLPVCGDDSFKGTKSIRFVNSGSRGLWEYSIKADRNGLTIDGGGCWALQKAAEMVADMLPGSIKTGFSRSGSVEGEFLFPLENGADLRILDDNIWDYSLDTIPPAWQKLGYDCRDANRGPQFAQMVRAYMPDVLSLQEYSSHMDSVFLPLIAQWGYVHTTTGADGWWNNTPVFYNKATLEMLYCDFCKYTPAKWSNHGSKSYTSAVFKRISDGKVFAVINTHLWWKSDKAQPGSNQARAAQIRLIIAEACCIKAKYDCPIFIMGDMNCEEDTFPIQQFITSGFVPCYKAATVYGNTENGHHVCSPTSGYDRRSNRRGSGRSVGAIDHCFIWNGGSTEVTTFDCLTPYFTVPLTDHYPNLIDAKL